MKLGRDPFARLTVTRKRAVSNHREGCDFCGAHNYDKRAGYRYLWKFIVSVDSVNGKEQETRGRFCSIGCCNHYHG